MLLEGCVPERNHASNNPVTLLDSHALYLKHFISQNKLQMDEW
jgi:hypothetical protein